MYPYLWKHWICIHEHKEFDEKLTMPFHIQSTKIFQNWAICCPFSLKVICNILQINTNIRWNVHITFLPFLWTQSCMQRNFEFCQFLFLVKRKILMDEHKKSEVKYLEHFIILSSKSHIECISMVNSTNKKISNDASKQTHLRSVIFGST